MSTRHVFFGLWTFGAYVLARRELRGKKEMFFEATPGPKTRTFVTFLYFYVSGTVLLEGIVSNLFFSKIQIFQIFNIKFYCISLSEERGLDFMFMICCRICT